MTSLAAAEAAALAQLAALVNRSDVVPLLETRAAAMRAAINSSLWDEAGGLGSGAFTNRLFNGSFFRRYSPTSFYPLIAGAASDDQVRAGAPRHLCVRASAPLCPHSSRAVLKIVRPHPPLR